MIKTDQPQAIEQGQQTDLTQSSTPALPQSERSVMKGVGVFAGLGLSLLSMTAKTSSAAIMKDTLSNPAEWQGFASAPSQYDSNLPSVLVAAFNGDGGQVQQVEVLFGATDGAGFGNVSPATVNFAVSFFNSESTWLANPFPYQSSPTTKFFLTPSNADWQTVVGTDETVDGNGDAHSLNLYLAKFDVSDMGWTTTPGAVQGIGVLPYDNQIHDLETDFALSTGIGGIGTDSDWLELHDNINNENLLGPGTLQQLNFPQPYGAFEITTSTVPEPSNLAPLAAAAAASLSVRRKRS